MLYCMCGVISMVAGIVLRTLLSGQEKLSSDGKAVCRCFCICILSRCLSAVSELRCCHTAVRSNHKLHSFTWLSAVEKLAVALGHNVLQLPEGGDFEALHCQPSTNFDRSTKLDLTTEPPLLGRCCYV